MQTTKQINGLSRKRGDLFDNGSKKVDYFHSNGMIFESIERPQSKGNIVTRDLPLVKRDKSPFTFIPSQTTPCTKKTKK